MFDHVNGSGCAITSSKDLTKTSVLRVQLQENGDMSTAAMKHADKSQLGVEVTAHTLYGAFHIIKKEMEAT